MPTFLRNHPQWLLFFAILLIGRLALSYFLPLMDSSESRYAEIARKMLEYNDWVTLWFKPEQPFWGKPPLAFWSVAASFGVFGVNELASRLPSLAFTLLTAWVLFDWVKRTWEVQTALYASTIYLGTWIVLYTAGTVITDPFLTFATTLVMVSFWDVIRPNGKTATKKSSKSAYLMWLALALGLLAKGPVALVLCGLACGIWVLIYKQWFNWFQNIRLFSGLGLMLLVALPWYYLAEQATPGFFDYFIVGEHFGRFLESGWSGDLYGPVKDQPRGLIWAYFLVALMPWSFFLLPRLLTKNARQALITSYQQQPQLIGYLLLWSLMPVIFFSVAKNILLTYVMPALPACSVLIALHFNQWVLPRQWLIRLATCTTVIFFIAISGVYYFSEQHDHRNQKPLILKYQELAKTDPGPLVYTGSYRFSAVFYTRDKNIRFGRETFRDYDENTAYFAVRDMWKEGTVRGMGARCSEQFVHHDFSLWYCPSVTKEP